MLKLYFTEKLDFINYFLFIQQILPGDSNTLGHDIKKPQEVALRKKLRRSVSFSEGSVTPTRSGYNEEKSSKYNAYSSSPFDKPDIAYSKRDQIQVGAKNK